MEARNIQLLAVDSLVPYGRNSRTHSDGQVEKLAQSIKEFGWTTPVLVDDDNGIIAGHGRVLAAKRLGLAHIPAMNLSGLSEAQKRAYIIADNQLALHAGWDEDMLAAELAALKAMDFNLELAGFDDKELEALLNHKAGTEGLPDEDYIPEQPAEPVSKVGDVWLLGDHRVMCGDSTSMQDVEILMAGNKAVMVFTDPPYNLKISTLGSGSENSIRNIHGEFEMGSGEMSQEEFTGFLSKIFKNLIAV